MKGLYHSFGRGGHLGHVTRCFGMLIHLFQVSLSKRQKIKFNNKGIVFY